MFPKVPSYQTEKRRAYECRHNAKRENYSCNNEVESVKSWMSRLIFISLCNRTSNLKLELFRLLASSYSSSVQNNRNMFLKHKGHIYCQYFFMKWLGGILTVSVFIKRSLISDINAINWVVCIITDVERCIRFELLFCHLQAGLIQVSCLSSVFLTRNGE